VNRSELKKPVNRRFLQTAGLIARTFFFLFFQLKVSKGHHFGFLFKKIRRNKRNKIEPNIETTMSPWI
jgi:hypothetical protein